MFGYGLSRYVPAAARPLAVKLGAAIAQGVTDTLGAQDLLRRRKQAPLPFRGERVALLGFVNAPTGLGRGVRLMHESYKRRGVCVQTFDIAPLAHRPWRARKLARAEVARLEAFDPTDIIVHANPPVMRAAVRRLPLSRTENACLVGYWAWELNRLPAHWRKDASICDAIWAPSAFVADAVRASLPDFSGAICVEPHDIASDALPHASAEDRRAARARIGLPPGAFIAGYSFAMASNFARKNPLAAVQAFQRAFSAGENALLLLRCADWAGFPPGEAALRAAAAADARVRLLSREDAQLLDFYQALDVYLSLHRSEGFGLQIAEAMQVGADAVATAWSLSESLTTDARFHGVPSNLTPVRDPQGVFEHIPGAEWAEPDLDAACEILRRIAARPRR